VQVCPAFQAAQDALVSI